MNRKILSPLLVVWLGIVFPAGLAAQTTAFTYQGQLADNGNPTSGNYDLQFTLYDSSGGMTVVGGPLTFSTVTLTNGNFTTVLDFGEGVFTGDARWLEIGVRTNGSVADFTLLGPRQEIMPTPYALYAPSAGTAASATTATVAIGTEANAVDNASLQANSVTTDKILDDTISSADIGILDDLDITYYLHLGGDIELGGQWSALNFNRYWDGVDRYRTDGYAGLLQLNADLGGFQWSAAPAGLAGEVIDWNVVRLSPEGHMGIGVWTPEARLEVFGNPRVDNDEPSQLRLTGGAGEGAQSLLDLATYPPGTNAPAARIQATDINYSAGVDILTKEPGAIDNPLVSRLHIAAGGNVGIGTTDPQATLDVAGSLRADTFSGSGAGLTGISGDAISSHSITSGQLAEGAAADNLATSGQGAVPSGGMILSSNANDVSLASAGYVKLGKVDLGDVWEERAGGAPSGRSGHTAVWTGTEMIVWGGRSGLSYLSDGGRYNPAANSWTAVTTSGAPAGRRYHTAVWTGTEMIVWGGYNSSSGRLDDGGRYNPPANSWTALAITGAPSARDEHTAVWTGTEMIVWGGYNNGTYYNDGRRYNPTANSWTAVTTASAPAARYRHTAVWTGTEMIVWGGYNSSSGNLDDGGRYNPTANGWTAVAMSPAPSARSGHTAVWTGSEMIVWGGGSSLNDGGRYSPMANSWTPMTTTGAPAGRGLHTATWTGSEMIVWGGSDGPGRYLNDGGRYNPGTSGWSAVTTGGAPAARQLHTAVWTGSEMIVWGGGSGSDFDDTFSYIPTRVLYLYQRP